MNWTSLARPFVTKQLPAFLLAVLERYGDDILRALALHLSMRRARQSSGADPLATLGHGAFAQRGVEWMRGLGLEPAVLEVVDELLDAAEAYAASTETTRDDALAAFARSLFEQLKKSMKPERIQLSAQGGGSSA